MYGHSLLIPANKFRQSTSLSDWLFFKCHLYYNIIIIRNKFSLNSRQIYVYTFVRIFAAYFMLKISFYSLSTTLIFENFFFCFLLILVYFVNKTQRQKCTNILTYAKIRTKIQGFFLECNWLTFVRCSNGHIYCFMKQYWTSFLLFLFSIVDLLLW